MPLTIILVILVFVGMFLYRRSHSLTRDCRWRARRSGDDGAQLYVCAACGAETFTTDGKPPRECKRDLGASSL
ncbi:MAG: hypothetical protein WCD16_08175 [Paracoccaceae bacterium]